MKLTDYLRMLNRRKWLVVCCVLTVVAVIAVGNSLTAPVYTASAKLRVSTGGAGSSDSWAVSMNLERVMSTYVDLATSRPVLEELLRRLNLPDSPTLKKRVEAEIVPNTELMQLSVDDADPGLAADEANTLAKILTERSLDYYAGSVKSTQQILNQQLAEIGQELDEARARYSKENIPPSIELKQNTYANLLQQYEQGRINEATRANILSIVEPAVAPDTPSKPRKAQNLAMGVLIGLVAGVGLALLFENVDTRLYSLEQVNRVVDLPWLGSVPTARQLQHCNRGDGNSRETAAFRRLLVNILAQSSGKPLRTVLVTSASPNEGKSTIAGNLARAMTKAGQRVVVVDTDFRSPSLHKLFDLPNRAGLSNVLKGEIDLENAVQFSKADARMAVLTSGPLPAGALEWHDWGSVTAVLEQLCQHFDIVLVDGPDLVSEPDTALLASGVHAVLLVVSLARSRAETVQAARKQLADVKARCLGVVVNRAERDGTC